MQIVSPRQPTAGSQKLIEAELRPASAPAVGCRLLADDHFTSNLLAVDWRYYANSRWYLALAPLIFGPIFVLLYLIGGDANPTITLALQLYPFALAYTVALMAMS